MISRSWFQSLPGNLGVPANRCIFRRIGGDGFNPFQGIWEFRHLIADLECRGVAGFNPFQGIWEFRPTNPSVVAEQLLAVSIPSREFGSSGPCCSPQRISNRPGCFNPFQGIWEFRPLSLKVNYIWYVVLDFTRGHKNWEFYLNIFQNIH